MVPVDVEMKNTQRAGGLLGAGFAPAFDVQSTHGEPSSWSGHTPPSPAWTCQCALLIRERHPCRSVPIGNPTGVLTMLKFLGSTIGIIFLIGLIVVIGFFMLVF
ncbi:hypothetical protein [Pseudomonas sp. B392_1p]|uniref:hypothetical protein n=1 Tax=Pseudomonas sp. B392_1p TaxID=3457507 RepID=UPI003FD022BC